MMNETHRPQRAIPDALRQTWERATQDPDPLTALDASNTLWQQWAQWQAALAAEALAVGATWEEIGHTLGTSRQAAWARFRAGVDGAEDGERPLPDQLAEARAHVLEHLKGLHARVKERDEAWKTDRVRLQEQVRIVDTQRAEERAALLEEIDQAKRKLKALRDQTRGPGVGTPAT